MKTDEPQPDECLPNLNLDLRHFQNIYFQGWYLFNKNTFSYNFVSTILKNSPDVVSLIKVWRETAGGEIRRRPVQVVEQNFEQYFIFNPI